MKIRYFAYGSNLDAQQMAERCPSAVACTRAFLADHRLDFTYLSARWNGGAADVLPHSGSLVWGAVYELHADDLLRLDHFEAGYERVLLRVRDDSDEEHQVVSYSVLAKRNFRPNEVYIEKMLRWGTHWGLPDDYLEMLRQVPVVRARGFRRLPD